MENLQAKNILTLIKKQRNSEVRIIEVPYPLQC